MMADRILDARHRPIVEERPLQRGVTQRRAAELVAIGRIPRDLLQAKVLVLTRSIEHDVALADTECGRDLRDANHVHLEVAEHFVRVTTDRMALTAPSLAEEDERTTLLLFVHRTRIAACESIDRCVGEDEREFELRDGAGEHGEVDWATGGN